MQGNENFFESIDQELDKNRFFPLEGREKIIFSHIIKHLENRNGLRNKGL
jgi:hypothetical protein